MTRVGYYCATCRAWIVEDRAIARAPRYCPTCRTLSVGASDDDVRRAVEAVEGEL